MSPFINLCVSSPYRHYVPGGIWSVCRKIGLGIDLGTPHVRSDTRRSKVTTLARPTEPVRRWTLYSSGISRDTGHSGLTDTGSLHIHLKHKILNIILICYFCLL